MVGVQSNTSAGAVLVFSPTLVVPSFGEGAAAAAAAAAGGGGVAVDAVGGGN